MTITRQVNAGPQDLKEAAEYIADILTEAQDASDLYLATYHVQYVGAPERVIVKTDTGDARYRYEITHHTDVNKLLDIIVEDLSE